jgi:hypothetical protein
METLPDLGDVPRDVLALVVVAKEAVEVGASDYVWAVLHELELDLAGELDRCQERRAA